MNLRFLLTLLIFEYELRRRIRNQEEGFKEEIRRKTNMKEYDLGKKVERR